jgi:tetratricopeptide (TPR) repeat protein
MLWKRAACETLVVLGMWAVCAHAVEIKITLPKHSRLTSVQRLNREGVEEVRKHNNEKAEALFYKAYLLDPEDPFTLNNLGYVSELRGEVDRAQRFYTLAKQEPTDAVIAIASSTRVQGRSVNQVAAIQGVPLQMDHDNVEAVRLLSQGRAPEVDLLLQKALKTDSKNVCTLNNMGVAKEMEGESQEALKFYDRAAALASDAAAVVTLNRSWRGKPVNQVAAQNASNLRSRLNTQRSLEVQMAELTLRGVSALNRNEVQAAETDFRAAYALDPNNAFALNNIGYLSELEGDRETAQFFYDKAQSVPGANANVGLATRQSADGLKLATVASDSTSKVDTKVLEERDLRRKQGEPALLLRRDNSAVREPSTPPANTPSQN